MSDLLGVGDYIVISIMLSISAGIGLYFRFTGDRQRTIREYLFADKNMSIIPVASSVMATSISAVIILGLPADVYQYGLHNIVTVIANTFGGLAAVYITLPVFFDMDASTPYEYLERRFGKATRYILSMMFCFQMILYMPIVIYAPSIALSTVTGLSLWASVLPMTIVCTFYTALGGLKAVLWTDLFQSILMFITVLSVLIKGIMESGGIKSVYENAKHSNRLNMFNPSLNFTERYTFWNCITHGLLLGFFRTGLWHTQVQRLMSVKNIKKAQRSFILSMPLSILFTSFCCFCGIVIYSYFHGCDPLKDTRNKIKSPDQLMPYMILKLYSHLSGVTGLCVAGIFSAALSTLSSGINAMAAVTLEDFIKPLMKNTNLTETTASYWAKAFGVIYGGLSILLIFIIAGNKGVLQASFMMSGMVAGPTLGVYFLGIFTSSANEVGTLIGLLTGFSINTWLAFDSLYNKSNYPSLPLSTENCTFGYNSLNVEANATEQYMIDSSLQNITHSFNTSHPNERYIFPMYRISYMWFPFISFCAVTLIGYSLSLIIGNCKTQLQSDKRLVGKFEKKLKFMTPKLRERYAKVPSKTNEIEMNEKICEGHTEDM